MRILGKSREIDLPDETLAWKVRAALRADGGRPRWQTVVQAINAMSPAEQKDSAWVYWKARGLQALAKDSQDGESLLAGSRELLASIAGQLSFYGELAAEELRLAQITLSEITGAFSADDLLGKIFSSFCIGK